jgi:hypothetical protein
MGKPSVFFVRAGYRLGKVFDLLTKKIETWFCGAFKARGYHSLTAARVIKKTISLVAKVGKEVTNVRLMELNKGGATAFELNNH